MEARVNLLSKSTRKLRNRPLNLLRLTESANQNKKRKCLQRKMTFWLKQGKMELLHLE